MVSSLLRKLARLAIVPTFMTAGCLALSEPAAATDYCVSPNVNCVHNVADLQIALNFAASAPDADRIFLGATTYASPDATGFQYNRADGPVEIIGAGRATTTLTDTAGFGRQNVLKVIGGPGSSVHDLAIQMPASVANDADGLETNASVSRVDVYDDPNQSQIRTGVRLTGGGMLENSTVTILAGQSTTGVFCVGAPCTVRNSVVAGNSAVQLGAGGSVERSYLNGRHVGVYLYDGKTTIGESLIRTTVLGATGIFVATQSPTGTTLDAHNLTMWGFASSTGIAGVTAPVQSPIDIKLTNSIVRSYTRAIDLYSFSGAPVKVTSSYNDYDASTDHINSPGATISESNVSYVLDPGFANVFTGNYRLSSSSPLVDAGDPATAQGVDLDGHPLVTDGDADGTARRDIGAYESDGALPGSPPPSGGGGAGDQPPSGGDQPPATGTGSTASTADTQPPLITGFRSSRNVFAVARARTAIAALARGTTLRYTLSEAAKVTIKIQRVKAHRASGTLTRRAGQGVNAVKFSGRIGSRALKPGRYTATITAVDAAGNRSGRKMTSFRVVP